MAGPARSGQQPAGPARAPPGWATEPAATAAGAESAAAAGADEAVVAGADEAVVAGADEAVAESVAAQDADGAGAKPAGLRAVFAALAANLGIAVTKFIAFAITGSASMLAESVHSVADSGNQVLLLLGRNRASRAPTEEHPFASRPDPSFQP